jgi:DNA-damage-inducible protein J
MRIAMMSSNAVVRARIDEHLKEEAAAVLAAMGLTVSDAFRLMMVRIAADKALPFEPLTPNAETIAAMRAARRGQLVTVGPVDSLIASLNAGD